MSAKETRRDRGPAAPTRRDVPFGFAPPTRRDTDTSTAAKSADPLQRALPSRLASRFQTVHELPASGAEADLLLVESRTDRQRFIAKIYRLGISPKFEVLDQIREIAAEHVVQRFEYGESDGRSFELLEYAEAGSLRALIDAEGPRLKEDTVTVIVRELVAALAALHAVNVVHRDLKPENVLVRCRRPLDLVLTDFGISSVVDASVRFSAHGHRTVAYAAPETSANAVSPALDYWSLGMMIAEMLLGRHPLGAVSEGVMLRHILTRPIPLEGLTGRWTRLCKGLLIRNDPKRWGEREVQRWLRGDDTIPLAADEGSVNERRRHSFKGTHYTTYVELANAMAADWDEAQKDVARGYLRKWVYEDLRDLEFTRFLDDLENDPSYKDTDLDTKVFWIIARMNPASPPRYMGQMLDRDSLGELALKASRGNDSAQRLLATIFDQRLLDGYSRITHQAWAGELHERWRKLDVETQAAREAFVGYSGLSESVLPKRGAHLAGLLLALVSPDFVQKLRTSLADTVREVGGDAPWLAKPEALPKLGVADLFVQASTIEIASTRHKQAEDGRVEERRQLTAENQIRMLPFWILGIWGIGLGVVVLNRPDGLRMGLLAKIGWLGFFPLLIQLFTVSMFRARFTPVLSAERFQRALSYPATTSLLAILVVGLWVGYTLPSPLPSPRAAARGIPAAERTRIRITASDVNVRVSPSASGRVVASAARDAIVPLVGQRGDWVQVDLASFGIRGTGWVHRSFTSRDLTPSPPPRPAAVAPATPATAAPRMATVPPMVMQVVEVSPKYSWSSVASVQAGVSVQIVATGQWNGDPAQPFVDARGNPGVDCEWPECALPRYRHSALIARIGEGAPFAIGASSFVLTPTTSGTLQMIINDHPCCFSDNMGVLNVTVRRLSETVNRP